MVMVMDAHPTSVYVIFSPVHSYTYSIIIIIIIIIFTICCVIFMVMVMVMVMVIIIIITLKDGKNVKSHDSPVPMKVSDITGGQEMRHPNTA